MKNQLVLAIEDAEKEVSIQTDTSLHRSDCQKQAQLPLAKSLKKRIGPYSFHLSDVIGRGFSSVVYRGIRDNDKSQQVALKVVTLVGITPHRRLLLENQAKILKKINHPHIVSLIEIYYTANNCYIVMEYCEGGSLQSLIDAKTTYHWPTVAQHVASACQYLAASKIMHRDIKPANVLIKGSQFKLADFGFAHQLNTIDQIIQEKYLIGSPLYMSPQSLMSNMYSLKGDAFAFGIFIYYISTLHFPWRGKDKHELMLQYEKRRASQRHLTYLPPKFKHYLNGLLQRDIQNRITVFGMDLQLFSRVKKSANIEQQLKGLSTLYSQQLKVCQFLHFLMENFTQWQHFNIFLMPMMSQHLGQLVEVFGWHKQPQLNQLKLKYKLPTGEFQFSQDQYHWLNNCVKDTILQLSSEVGLSGERGMVLKLLQYQRLIQNIMYGNNQEICRLIDSFTLHETFDLVKPAPQEINRFMDLVDFYQL